MAELEDGFETGFVKIGVTRDEISLGYRESNVGTGNPRKVEIKWTWLFKQPGQAFAIETIVKERLNAIRIPDKEWFRFDRKGKFLPSTVMMREVDKIIEEIYI